MDEFTWSPRLMRRMALLGLLNCVALQATAAEQPATTDRPAAEHSQAVEHKQDDLSSLLKQGWDPSAKPTTVTDPARRQPPTAAKSTEAVTPDVKPQPTVTAAAPPVMAAPVVPVIPPEVTPADAAEENELAAGDQSLVPIFPIAKQPLPIVTEQVEPDHGLKRVEAGAESRQLADLLKDAPDVASEVLNPKPLKSIRRATNRPISDDLVEQSLEVPARQAQTSELLREAATNSGFGMLALESLESPVIDTEVTAKPLQSEIIQSTRLQEVAQRLLREANNSLRRKADFTARKKAIAALRTAVAMRDADEGNNHNSNDLELALDAIRESRDFGVGTASVDHAAIKRFVAVHKTAILKDQDMSDISSLGAMSAYLEFAHEKLVAASGQLREASDALILLGKVEKRLKGPLDPVASAITLTYQRAAADVDPTNAQAFYEMGKSLDSAGMVDQARVTLTKSVQLGPSRHGYEKLLETARKAGDIDTVNRCKLALSDVNLPPKTAVLQLQPQVFAAMHRPQTAQTAKSDVPVTRAATPPRDSNLQDSSSDVPAMTRLKTWFAGER